MTEELRNPASDTVTVWSDIGCPWATLALHTLRARAAERGRRLLVDHRAFPLELFNNAPTPKLILDAEIVTIAGARPEVGWRLWSAPESTYPVTTLPAMEAVQAAKDPDIGGLPGSDELDAALRAAFYAEGRCISIHPVILEIAEGCAHVDHAALARALAAGRGRAEVYRQWETAKGPAVQGSPHLFTAHGYAAHNPGATYHWTGRFPTGLPRLDEYDPAWADTVLDQLTE
ncbi:DsbA family oxidoreductase [Gandjariella thermophila]|uniref:Dithiol-disulfide isomerase n=1 Tax=Gandjariella thermophila TaxID=1931992 RepID=A0A4D4J7I2_9PSEU|nr:DsbA family protein [Gandjariella thermophila]GDY32755.1 dithiol-disulfide isomerase [Gandjariella thermophila]